MDPTTLMQMLSQQTGRSPGQMPPMGQPGQMQPMGQMPPQGAPMGQQGQLPSMMLPQGMGAAPPQDQSQGHHHGGISPWMLLSPLGGLLAGGGGMGALAPMFGLAGLFGSKLFK